MPEINLLHIDCLEYMKGLPDKAFDLAIVDPPYGIDADNKNNGANSDRHRKTSKAKLNTYKTGWDSDIPTDEYFTELFRVSKRQIVWGANFFGLKGGYLYWHKNVTMPTYSTGEVAWISWKNKMDFLELTWHGMLQHDMKNKEIRTHPTQKPVALYKWLLENYAKEGDKILDTHLGSGSIAIACHDYGFDLTGCELDEDYYKAAVKRFNNHASQLKLIA
jgi:site-specific DNA-methyltransferase (adenine-specific)